MEVLNYDPKPYLKKILPKNQKWYVLEDFTLFLLLIRGRIQDFTVNDLLDTGWRGKSNKRVITAALSDYKKNSVKRSGKDQGQTKPINKKKRT